MFSEDSKRCCNICPKTGRRCLLENDKDKAKNKKHKRHMYTPKNLLSPSTIEKLMKELTSGGLQSRAGLDNIYIEKGAENFAEMISIIETLSTFLGNKEIAKTLCEEVEKVETFHKVHFERHLRHTNDKHSCMCLQCGFTCAEDPIRCPNDHFAFPCKECQDSFAIFDKIDKLYEEVKEIFMKNNIFNVQPEMEDDMLEWKERLIKCRQYLQDYRAHLVDKVSESNFDKMNSDLEMFECLCVIDYKMKVLPKSYREKMIDWYSKRGISVLGVELHMMVDGERKVFYHFFISDDVNQDTEAVLCAKHFLYSEIFPKYNIKKVKFRCDGAGCFSSNEAKASMKLWGDLCEAAEECGRKFSYETVYKVMVAGCGKTALDGEWLKPCLII